jgi:hypothetical protein
VTIELLALENAEPPAEGQVAPTVDEASFATVFAELTGGPVSSSADDVSGDAVVEDEAPSETVVVDPAAILALWSDVETPTDVQPAAIAEPDSASNPVADPDQAPGNPLAGETAVVVPDVPDVAAAQRVTEASAPIAPSARSAPSARTVPAAPAAVPRARLESVEAVAAVAEQSVAAVAADAAPVGQVADGDPRAFEPQLALSEAPAPGNVVSSEAGPFEAPVRQWPVGPEAEHPVEAPRSQAGSGTSGRRSATPAPIAQPAEAFEALAPARPPASARANGVAVDAHSAPPTDATSGRTQLAETFAPAAPPAGTVTRESGNDAAEGDAGGAGDGSLEHRAETPVVRPSLASELARALGEAEAAVETPLPAAEPAPAHLPRAAAAASPVPAQPGAPSGPSPAFTAPAAMRAFAPPAEHDDVIVPQLVRAMHLQMVRGVGEARLHLEPHHLGAVSVALRVANGVVSAVVTAEQPSVRHWIEAHESTLRQALADQGLELEKLQVHEDGRSPFDESRRHDEPARRRTPRRDTATFELVA